MNSGLFERRVHLRRDLVTQSGCQQTTRMQINRVKNPSRGYTNKVKAQSQTIPFILNYAIVIVIRNNLISGERQRQQLAFRIAVARGKLRQLCERLLKSTHHQHNQRTKVVKRFNPCWKRKSRHLKSETAKILLRKIR